MIKNNFIARCSFAVFFAILLSKQLALAQGGPPMLTDDSGTPGDGKWENNFAFVFDGSKNDYTKDFPVADINYGVGERIQLKVEMGWVAGKGEPLAGKFDYLEFGVKYRFLDEKKDGVSLSTYPQPIASFDADDKSKTPEFGFLLPIAISKEIDGVNINFQTGYQVLGSQTEWIFGLVLAHDFSKKLTMLAELHNTLGRSEDLPVFESEIRFNIQTFFDLGAQINLSDTYTILAAVGKDIGSPSFISADANFYGYFGLQLHL